MNIVKWSSLVAAGAFATVMACDEVSFPIADTEEFIATLSPANENPPVTGSSATCTAFISVFQDTILTYRVDVANMDSTTLSHIHAGPADSNGAVIVDLFIGNVACKQNAGGARTIVSSSVANPTVVTLDSAHGQAVNSTFLVRIAGHASTPSLNGEFTATSTGATTFTVPVNVTAGATGGTAQRFTLINAAAPRCRPAFAGPLNQAQQKYSALTKLPTAWGATARERFDSLVARMRIGRVYVNVHNSVNPAGHMRGQIGPR